MQHIPQWRHLAGSGRRHNPEAGAAAPPYPMAHTSLAVVARCPFRTSGASHLGLVTPPPVEAEASEEPIACCADSIIRERLKSLT